MAAGNSHNHAANLLFTVGTALALAACNSSSSSRASVGDACESAWACKGGLVCLHGYCRQACLGSDDCDERDTRCADGACTPVPNAECDRDSACSTPGYCELSSGTRCFEGFCQYPSLTCDRPPEPVCESDALIRLYDVTGTCGASDCSYGSSFVSCPACPSCISGCVLDIDGDQIVDAIEEGTLNPGDPCLRCDPSVSRATWTPVACALGSSANACLAATGTCRASCAEATGTCVGCTTAGCDHVCDHAPLADDTSCGTGVVCVQGVCGNDACVIGGTVYANGTFNPVTGCERCDTATSTTTWTPYVCETGGGECRATTGVCETSAGCAGQACCVYAPLWNGSGSAPACGSGTCQRCDAAGTCVNAATHEDCTFCEKCSGGLCVPQSSSEDLKLECTASECASGECDGARHCEYATTDAACGGGICHRCDGTGGCQISTTDADCTVAGEICSVTGVCVGSTPCTVDAAKTYCGAAISAWDAYPTNINCVGSAPDFVGWINMAVPSSYPATVVSGVTFATTLVNDCSEGTSYTCLDGVVHYDWSNDLGETSSGTCAPLP